MIDEDQEILDEFNKEVEWLRKVIPPDDIYDFAQQTLMAGDFLIDKLSEKIDLKKEIAKDEYLLLWVRNIKLMMHHRKENNESIINTKIKQKKRL